MKEYNRELKQPSRELRKNPTPAESLLWSKLRNRQQKNLLFYRQKPLGEYIVDFYCPGANLVIELDGSRHFTGTGREYDRVRDEFLNSMELSVLRFTNTQVLHGLEQVLVTVVQHLPG